MKFLSEYRDQKAAEQLAGAIRKKVTRPWAIMEICGGQTQTIVKSGLEDLLPKEITLVHGPGCPVCVTPIELIDKAVAIAKRPDAIFCSFGDMLRVPGSSKSLFDAKAEGADARIVYSPLDALGLAKQNPEKQVVFFAVGFETTAPANAMAAWQADHDGVENFSLLVSHVLVPPAMEALLSSDNCVVQGFLAAGHVCTIMGFEEYFPIAAKYEVPIVVTGFEPLDILEGIFMTVSQLEEGRHEVENQYARAVRREGNRPAQKRITEVFEIVPRQWRGLGEVPASGFQLRGRFQKYDANRRFPFSGEPTRESPECISGLILQGIQKPHECPAFAVKCTPEIRWGRPWYRRKARARPMITMADAKITSFSLSCPVPRVADDRIVLAHGGGGRLTHQLIEKIFMPAFANDALEQRHDGAVVSVSGARLAFTTDSFVVRPLIFPGGNIGDLAVNGTENDLAMLRRPTSLPERRIHPRRRSGDGNAAHSRDLDAASSGESECEAGDRRYEGR